MPPKKQAEAAKPSRIEALRDGVFVADDVRLDKGEVAEAAPEVAKLLCAHGFARVV